MHDRVSSRKLAIFPHWRLSLLTLFVGLAFSITALAASPASFSGTYHLDRAASDDLSAVLEPAFAELNLFKRTLGQRLFQSRVLPDLQEIDVEAGEISLKVFDGRRSPLEIPSTGEEIDHQTDRGNWMKVRGELTGDVFRARITGEKSIAYLHSRLSPQGDRLDVQVKFEHHDFTEPLYFNLVYRRMGAAPGDALTEK